MKLTLELPMLKPMEERSYTRHFPLRIEQELKSDIDEVKSIYGKHFLEGMRVVIRQYVAEIKRGIKAHE